MSEKHKHHHRHYRLGGWVAPLCPAQFPGSPGADTTVTNDPGSDMGAGMAGDAGTGASV